MSRTTGDHLPTGTVTFVFTDIEGSTLLLQQLGSDTFARLLEVHAHAVAGAFEAHHGVVVGSEGDSYFCVFKVASDAVAAAAAAQRALAEAEVPGGGRLRVRMGMHTGEGQLASAAAGGDYVGLDVHRAARVASAGHGGQVLLSETTRALVHDRLPADASLIDLGPHRFKDLGQPERVYQLAIAGLPSSFPRIRSLDRVPNNLPSQLTSFIGREDDIQRGMTLLASTRLLTLTGPGGTGKTRLSLQIAAAATGSFPDGVHFAALASLTDPSLVITRVAHDLGLPPDGIDPLERLVRHLADKKVLVVLDNFEQLVDAAPQVGELLRRVPGLKLIVTSRAALRVSGEQEMPVPPLDLPDPAALPAPERLSQFEAVRLFIERARASKPDFAVTNDNAPAVAGICARLDGLPLAIELAAARVRVLTPQAIHQRLAGSAALLGGGARDLPARQQTLRGAIAWSYDLLDEDTRRLYQALSWFAGGAYLPEVEAVWAGAGGDPAFALDGLTLLAEHSLVRQRDEAIGPRFSMLQTIREYGLEKLGESATVAAAVRRQHALAYLAVAKEQAPRVMTSARRQAIDRIEADLDNLRVALDWAVGAGERDLALRLVVSLWRTWQARGYLDEGAAATRRVLAMPGAADSPHYGGALEALGGIVYWMGDVPGTRAIYEQLLAVSRASGDAAAIANAGYNLSFPMVFAGDDMARVHALVDEALAIYRRLGDRAGIAKTLWCQSQLPILEGKPESAHALVDEAVAMFRQLDDPFGLGWVLHTRVWLNNIVQDWNTARVAAHEALRIFADMRDLSGITLILGAMARTEAGAGAVDRAITLQAASASLARRTSMELMGEVQRLFFQRVNAEVVPEERTRALVTAGAAMTCDEAVAYALAAPPS